MKKYALFLFVFALFIILLGFNAKPASATNISSDCTITSILRIGSTGDEVACLQLHIGLISDGKFGPRTQIAVKAFQANAGLKADGVVGPKSISALEVSNSVTPTSSPISVSTCTTSGYDSATGFRCGCSSVNGYSSTTGLACGTASNFRPGCTSTFGFSSVDGSSCGASTTITATPFIYSMTPFSAKAGDTVTIYGSNFDRNSWISIGGAPGAVNTRHVIQSSYTPYSPTSSIPYASITFVVPIDMNAGTFPVLVVNRLVTGDVPSSNQATITVTAPVCVNGFSSTTGFKCGCTSTLGFSSTNGEPCDGSGVSTPTTLSVTTPSVLPNAKVGQYYFISLNVAGGNGYYNWSLNNNASSFPVTGLGFASSNTQSPYSGNGITGIPASNTNGTYAFTVNVTSGSQSVSKQFTLTVNPADTATCSSHAFDSTTGNPLPCGCTSTSGFSSTNGEPCDGSGVSTPTTLSNTVSGTLTPSASTCYITAGNSICAQTLSWTTANPIAGHPSKVRIFSNQATPNTVTKDTGSQAFTFPYTAGRNLLVTLYNGNYIEYGYDNVELARANVATTCVAGTSWDGTKCASH